jgi:hypothetical protein
LEVFCSFRRCLHIGSTSCSQTKRSKRYQDHGSAQCLWSYGVVLSLPSSPLAALCYMLSKNAWQKNNVPICSDSNRLFQLIKSHKSFEETL